MPKLCDNLGVVAASCDVAAIGARRLDVRRKWRWRTPSLVLARYLQHRARSQHRLRCRYYHRDPYWIGYLHANLNILLTIKHKTYTFHCSFVLPAICVSPRLSSIRNGGCHTMSGTVFYCSIVCWPTLSAKPVHKEMKSTIAVHYCPKATSGKAKILATLSMKQACHIPR